MWSDIVDGCFINLDFRKDRLQTTQTFLKQWQVPETKMSRVDAYHDPQVGFRGCTYSHLRALERLDSNENPGDYFLFLEDDLEWETPADTNIQQLENIWKKIQEEKINFDLLYLTMSPILIYSVETQQEISLVQKEHEEEKQEKKSELVQVRKATGLAGYVIRRGYLSKMRKMYQRALEYELPHDVVSETEQQQDKWYGIFPPLIRQSKGYSDIEKRHVNYQKVENGLLFI